MANYWDNMTNPIYSANNYNWGYSNTFPNNYDWSKPLPSLCPDSSVFSANPGSNWWETNQNTGWNPTPSYTTDTNEYNPSIIFNQSEINNTIENIKSNYSSEESEILTNEIKRLKGEDDTHYGSLGSSLLTTSVFAAPAITKGCQVKKNQYVNKMFFETKAAQDLWKNNPDEMAKAQKVMQKNHKQFLKEYKKCTDFTSKSTLVDNYEKYISYMQKAIDDGEVNKVTKLTQQYEDNLNHWYKREKKSFNSRKITPSIEEQPNQKTKTEVDNKKASSNKKKSSTSKTVKRYLGGKAGLTMFALQTGLMYAIDGHKKVQEAAELGEEERNKQFWHSLGEAALPSAGYIAGDAIGHNIANKFISKNAEKIGDNLGDKKGKAVKKDTSTPPNGSSEKKSWWKRVKDWFKELPKDSKISNNDPLVDNNKTPKKGIKKFFNKVGNFFKKTGKKIGKFCKPIKNVCKNLVKPLGKVLKKVAIKAVTKISGKAIGAVIGSFIPGAGTIVGLAIGAALDWVIGKYVVPAIFGKNDEATKAAINNMTDQEREKVLVGYVADGRKINPTVEEVLTKKGKINPNVEETSAK